ncbi:MAG: hypothetical protein ACREE4_21675 [Stellaceae bacterium]
MGGFFIAVAGYDADPIVAANAARLQFRQSGLGEPVRIEDPAYILDYYPKHGRAAADLVRFGDTDFIASCGTFIYSRRSGPEALRLFWRESNHAAALAGCRGHYALIERRAGRTTLLRDPLGAYEVYHDRNFRIISASFLALARNIQRRTVHAAECIEYVLNGVTFGTETPIEEVQRLDMGEAITFDPVPRIIHRDVILCPGESPSPLSEQLRQNILVLQEYLASLAEAFQGRIKLSFSGGYDSRLLLAALRSLGITPSLFVYGPESGHDVRAAKQLAGAENIPLEHVDKERCCPVTPERFPQMARENFHWYDGFPQMGMFHSNAENIIRVERSLGDVVILNGGGGEVYRNFFKFVGRNLSARNFVRCFLSHFNPAILAAPALHACFEDGLTRKVEALLGVAGSKLDRRQVECLYPHFRCRSWFGRANSLDNRFGSSILPYYDQRVVESALCLPIRSKHFGNFESLMIRELDHALARHPSSHGFPFDGNTPLGGMIPDLLLYALPPSLRRLNYRIKERLGRYPRRFPILNALLLTPFMDASFPFMSRLFAMPRVRSHHQFERIAVLEYLFQFLDGEGSR